MDRIQFFHGEFLNANIFNNDQNSTISAVSGVSKTVAKFYVILRNIAAVVMLAGLIFTGIRILLSANIPTKKTQYLMLLQDWIIGMVLLIFSHIIMIFIFTISDSLVLAMKNSIGQGSMKLQLLNNGNTNIFASQVIALVLYGWTFYLTGIFIIAYFKRFFWTCILTIFAPIMCLMYSFGQQTKQIYSNWLKEYMLNVFVQPFHIIVYLVLVALPLKVVNSSGTTDLMTMIYSLMAMYMILPAEKYLRGLFGMNKGIANMASYDSGKQTVNAVKDTITNVGKEAIKLGMMASTGVDTTGILKGAGGSTNEILDEPEKEKQWISEGWEKDSQGRYQNPYNDEWYTEKELMAGQDLPGYMKQDDFDEGDAQTVKEGFKEAIKGQERRKCWNISFKCNHNSWNS